MSDTGINQTIDTGNGVFTGTGITAASTPEQLRAQQAALTGQPVPMTPPVDVQAAINAAMEKARQEERDKLYPQLSRVDEMAAQLKALQDARDEEAAARQKEIDDAKAAADAAENEKLTLTQRLQKVEQETQQRFEQLQQERETALALFERERQFMALQQFRDQQVAAVAQDIHPALLDYIQGNSEEEILASIASAKERSAAILNDVRQYQAQQWQGMRGTMPTAPAMGPMENAAESRPMSPQEIAAMSQADYARNRGALLGAASQYMRSQKQ